MNKRQSATLAAIFAEPTRSDINWKGIMSLFTALGAEVSPGEGSRWRVFLNGRLGVFHRPHEKDTDKGEIVSIRRFLTEAGVTPPWQT